MRELTRKETDRQDFVDNAIYRMVENLRVDTGNQDELEWDVESIARIREEVFDYLKRYELVSSKTERDFYPWIDNFEIGDYVLYPVQVPDGVEKLVVIARIIGGRGREQGETVWTVEYQDSDETQDFYDSELEPYED